MSIGVFDSGLGGLTILRVLRRALPNQSFLYFGDNAHTPYGDKSREEVQRLTRLAVERMFAEGCDLVILACNTASALALRDLQDGLPSSQKRRVLGVFVPMIEAVSGARWVRAPQGRDAAPAGRRRIVFFATPATVASGSFGEELQKRLHDAEQVSQPCPTLVAELERGDEAAARASVAAACAAALEKFAATPDAAVLGCTHYPLAYDAFRASLPPETEILSQPDITAASLARYLERHPEFEDTEGALRCLTSGDPVLVGELATLFYRQPLSFDAA